MKLMGNTTRKETIEMVKYFSEHHRTILQGGTPKPGLSKVASCAWFKLEPLIGYLNDLQKNGADGVRLYFGAHPKDEQEGYNNVILVGTKFDGKKKNEDVKDEKAFEGSGYAYTAGQDYDNAHLCPPNCDCGEDILFEATGEIPGCP